ncbi:hypothetical protein D3C81_2217710 [compost metagenome]
MLSSIAGGFIAKQMGFSGLFSVSTALAAFSFCIAWLVLSRFRQAGWGAPGDARGVAV